MVYVYFICLIFLLFILTHIILCTNKIVVFSINAYLVIVVCSCYCCWCCLKTIITGCIHSMLMMTWDKLAYSLNVKLCDRYESNFILDNKENSTLILHWKWYSQPRTLLESRIIIKRLFVAEAKHHHQIEYDTELYSSNLHSVLWKRKWQQLI